MRENIEDAHYLTFTYILHIVLAFYRVSCKLLVTPSGPYQSSVQWYMTGLESGKDQRASERLVSLLLAMSIYFLEYSRGQNKLFTFGVLLNKSSFIQGNLI